MTALVNALWQGLAVTAITALLLKSLPHSSAATRHSIWWAALTTVLGLAVHHLSVGLETAIGATTPRFPAVDPAGGVGPMTLMLPAPPAWMLGAGIFTWLVWAICGSTRLGGSIWAVRRLKDRAVPIDERLQRQLPMWIAARGSGRRLELRQSDEISCACAAGLFGRPTIIIPTRLIERLPPRDLDLIVMHEHAHLERHDDWSRLAQALICVVAGLHPAVALIGRQIDFEREAACDDRVVARVGAALGYARCLADAADVAASGAARGLVRRLAPGALTTSHELVARVARLVGRDSASSAPLARLTAACCTAACAGATLVVVSAGPIVVMREVTTETTAPVVPPVLARGPEGLRPMDWPLRAAPGVPVVLSSAGISSRPRKRAAQVQVRPSLRDAATPRREQIEMTSKERASLGPAVQIQPTPSDAVAAPEDARQRGQTQRDQTVIASRTLAAPLIGPVGAALRPAASDAPWSAASATWGGTRIGVGAAHAGLATATSMRSAGVAIGRVFTLTGRRIARHASAGP